MVFEQVVEFVTRQGSGHQAKGSEWRTFMNDQQEAIDHYTEDGYALVAAIGVQLVTLEGVLLYFRKEG